MVYVWSGPGIPVGTSGQTALVEDYNPNMSGLFTINLEVFDAILPSCAILPLEIQVEVLEKPSTPSLASDSELVCEGAEVTFTASGDFTGVTAYFFIGDEVFGSADSEFTLIDIPIIFIHLSFVFTHSMFSCHYAITIIGIDTILKI